MSSACRERPHPRPLSLGEGSLSRERFSPLLKGEGSGVRVRAREGSGVRAREDPDYGFITWPPVTLSAWPVI